MYVSWFEKSCAMCLFGPGMNEGGPHANRHQLVSPVQYYRYEIDFQTSVYSVMRLSSHVALESDVYSS